MKIAIFHHCVLKGPRIPSEQHAFEIMFEQMHALWVSGLEMHADEIHLGMNGEGEVICPTKTVIHRHPDGQTEIPTLKVLQDWLRPGWRVLYTHSKGASYPLEHTFPDHWRRCMERGVVWNWRGCMSEMDVGIESCGCHWLTPERWGSIVKTPFWGGTFWWATSDYLMTLPPLPEDKWENRHEAESWIGRGPRRPKIKDWHPQWPGASCSSS